MMTSHTLRFGKGPFSAVFPSIEEIAVDIRAWPDGIEKSYGVYDASNLSRFVDCWNPRCRGGKFDIEHLIREMLPERRNFQCFSLTCSAHEFGRNALPCSTKYEIKIEIRYRRA